MKMISMSYGKGIGSGMKLIVAVSKNNVIGNKGELPWYFPEDSKRFKELTMGGVLFVGKGTAKTMPPLKGREVVVLGRKKKGPTIANMKKIAAEKEKTGWLIGGAQIYKKALEANVIDEAYITLIEQEFEGDTFFDPCIITKNSKWTLVKEELLKVKNPTIRLQHWMKATI